MASWPRQVPVPACSQTMGFIEDSSHGKWKCAVNAEAVCQRNNSKKKTRLLGATPTTTQSSALLTLPTELVLQILAYAGSVDQLFLALSCKRLLLISSLKDISIPCAPKHRAHGTNCSAMLAILRALQPLNTQGRANKTWAPCCDCYRYRPRKKSYWKMVGKRYQVNLYVGCKILSHYDDVVESWSCKRSCSYQCPECWCSERISKYGQPKDCDHC